MSRKNPAAYPHPSSHPQLHDSAFQQPLWQPLQQQPFPSLALAVPQTQQSSVIASPWPGDSGTSSTPNHVSTQTCACKKGKRREGNRLCANQHLSWGPQRPSARPVPASHCCWAWDSLRTRSRAAQLRPSLTSAWAPLAL